MDDQYRQTIILSEYSPQIFVAALIIAEIYLKSQKSIKGALVFLALFIGLQTKLFLRLKNSNLFDLLNINDYYQFDSSLHLDLQEIEIAYQLTHSQAEQIFKNPSCIKFYLNTHKLLLDPRIATQPTVHHSMIYSIMNIYLIILFYCMSNTFQFQKQNIFKTARYVFPFIVLAFAQQVHFVQHLSSRHPLTYLFCLTNKEALLLGTYYLMTIILGIKFIVYINSQERMARIQSKLNQIRSVISEQQPQQPVQPAAEKQEGEQEEQVKELPAEVVMGNKILHQIKNCLKVLKAFDERKNKLNIVITFSTFVMLGFQSFENY